MNKMPVFSQRKRSRRSWIQSSAGWLCGSVPIANAGFCWAANSIPTKSKARIAITLDLEMSRNFPRREDTHWDFEKGNLNDAAKSYAVEAAKRVKQSGGRIHFFCVGRVLEQANIDWLTSIAKEGHPIGNHTYDHVNLLANSPQDLQYRFQRSPWLIEGRTTAQVIYENIRLTTLALRQRASIENRGFRTPGGFSTGLQGREDLQEMLLNLGFKWVSSFYPAHSYTAPQVEPDESLFDNLIAASEKAQPFVYPTGLLEIPMSPISDIGAFRTGQWKLEWFLEAIRRVVLWTIDHKATFDFLAHPSCLGVLDPEFKAIDLICRLVKESGHNAELVDLDQIAAASL
jgi:peptidoglycan/xylan/chitin deacetylase (PgdA/CDA1 family)